MKTVAVIVGSLRRESINRRLARGLGKLAAPRLDFKIAEIGDLPLYNDDLWENPPEAIWRFKREVEAADGVLFVSPEYNRGYTPAIKNAIDWGTRPWGQTSWPGKPAGLVGASQGAIGSAVGQAALRSVLVALDLALLGAPEVYITYKPELFGEDDEIADPSARKFLQGWVERFAGWVEHLTPLDVSGDVTP